MVYGLAAQLKQRVANGEADDVAILIRPMMEDLLETGEIDGRQPRQCRRHAGCDRHWRGRPQAGYRHCRSTETYTNRGQIDFVCC